MLNYAEGFISRKYLLKALRFCEALSISLLMAMAMGSFPIQS
jgi:hypothetical protein